MFATAKIQGEGGQNVIRKSFFDGNFGVFMEKVNFPLNYQ